MQVLLLKAHHALEHTFPGVHTLDQTKEFESGVQQNQTFQNQSCMHEVALAARDVSHTTLQANDTMC